MHCSSIVERLSSYLDGALDERTLEIVESHLESCSECRRLLASMKALVTAAGQIEDAEPPAHLRQSILAAVRTCRQRVRQCAKASVLASASLDGEASDREEALVAAHLRECPDCASEHSALRALVHTARNISMAVPPSDLRSRIMAAVSAEPVPSQSIALRISRQLNGLFHLRSSTVRWAGGLVAAGVFALMIVFPTGISQGPSKVRPSFEDRASRSVAEKAAAQPASIALSTSTGAQDAARAARPTRAASAPSRIARTWRSGKQIEKAVAERPTPVSLLKPAPEHAVEHEPAIAELPQPQAEESTTVTEESAAVEMASNPAPAIENGSEAKTSATPAPVKVAVATFTEDARAWASEMKQKAAMQRGADRSSGIQIITTRF